MVQRIADQDPARTAVQTVAVADLPHPDDRPAAAAPRDPPAALTGPNEFRISM